MRRQKRIVLILAVFALVTAAADGAEKPDRVVEVRVEGNKQMSRGGVLMYVKTRAGQPYSENVVNDDKDRLLKSGRFRSIRVETTRTAKGVIVTFTVTERPLVAKLTFQGNKAYQDSELTKELRFGVRDAMNRFNVEKGRRDILRKYRNGGYHFAAVTVDAEALKELRVLYRIVEGPKVVIRKLRFSENHTFGNLRLRQEVSVAARFWPFVAGTLDSEEVERSVNAIRSLYVREGYLDAEVGRLMEFSDDKKDVTLTFVIKEGIRYRINKVIFRGNEVFRNADLAKRLALRQGESFTALALYRDVRKLQDTYGELGYIEASVDARKIFVDPTAPPPAWARGMKPKPAMLNLIFTITERDQYHIGRVIIRGNTTTQSRVVRRELHFFPRQLFNTVAVKDSERRLYESRLFQKVDIIPMGKEPKVRDVLVRVQEGKTADFLVGVGLSSSSGVLGNISFRQRNFDIFGWPKSRKQFMRGQAFKGAGQTLSIVAEPGTELMRFHVDWREPYLFDQPYSLGLRGFLFSRERETYDETRYGGVVSVGHRFRNRWYGEVATRIEGVNISDLDSDAPPEVMDDEGTHALVGLKGTLVRDRTDSRWLPSAGDRFRLSYEQMTGSYTFGRAVGDYRIYRTVYLDALDRKHILAGRVTLGHIFGDAPVFERFYGGGIGSVRGFQYRGISPRSDGTDEVIGGEMMVFAGCEYTFPLIGKTGEGLRGVVFIDTGTVEEKFTFTSYRASAGVGVRWTVPFFGPIPISFDFGFPLNKDDDDDTQIFSFSLGWTF